MTEATGIHDLAISDLPIAIVDLETTGLSTSTGDKIVEIAIVRVEPDGSSRVVLDTLVNPKRRVTGTWIHGITDEDVVDAPTFPELAREIVQALDSCVLASYNIYFDAGFLEEELYASGVRTFPPHFCLMYMRPLLGIGKKCCLEDACKEIGIPVGTTHQASVDAMLGLKLWQFYSGELGNKGIRTFGELAKAKKYKYNSSFQDLPLRISNHENLPIVTSGTKPRKQISTEEVQVAAKIKRQQESAARKYFEALNVALADDCITRDELETLISTRNRLQLTRDDLRWVHACVFDNVLRNLYRDEKVDDADCTTLADLAAALHTLGWAPGDPVPSKEPTPIILPGTKPPSFWSRWFGLRI
jgi:DNA polymerase III epsilon subunit-like protein